MPKTTYIKTMNFHIKISALQRSAPLLAIIANSLGLVNTAHADEEAGVLQEVIVTAERRATTEQTTAISMNVLTAEDLASSRTQIVADLQQTTPNITINQAGVFNSINIRGIGNSAANPTITTGVAVIQDGLLNAETATLGSAFLDLASIEVLRGPQGTFIGASSTGGAVRLNSVKPNFSGVSGYVEGLAGTYSDVKVTGAVNLPVSDTFAARIAFNSERRNSYFYSAGTVPTVAPTNPFNQPGKLEDMNARISLLWTPNDAFEAIWRSESNRADNEGSPYQPNPRTFANALGAQTRSRYWNYDDANHDPTVLSINVYDTQNITVIDRHSLEINQKFNNGMTLRSLTGFVHNEIQYTEDNDGSSANASVTYNDVGPKDDYYSQEINLISPTGPLNWIVGASWFYRNTPVNLITEAYTCGISSANGTSINCPPQYTATVPGLTLVNSQTTARSLGIFGQVNQKLSDTFELSAGVRMNYDRNFIKGYNNESTIKVTVPAPVNTAAGRFPCTAAIQALPQLAQLNAAGTPYSCLFIGQASTYEEDTPTWKLGLNWTPSDNNFLYAFWSRGYKAGGVDTQGRFERELVDDYELGWKSKFAEGRMQLSLGGFWMDYQDMQQSAFRATPTNASAAVYNVGSATIRGIEAEFDAKLAGLGIQANMGYTDSELGAISLIDRTRALDSDVRAPGSTRDLPQCTGAATYPTCVDWLPYYTTVAGLSNIYSPELSYGLSVDYAIPAGNGVWTPRVTFSHTDAQDTNLLKREAFFSIEERNLLNLSLTYTQNEWLIQAYCNNCSDDTYIASIGTAADNALYGAPRTLGIRVKRTF